MTSRVLKTWDFGLDDVIDRLGVSAYIAEAVARYDEYKADTARVLNASRTAARVRKRPKASGA